MKTKNPSPRSETQNLSVRYGEIGISAVAAAMRYQAKARLKEAPAQRTLEEIGAGGLNLTPAAGLLPPLTRAGRR